MDLGKLTEIFTISPNVRFIGVVDKKDNVLLSKMREGIARVNPNQTDEEMVSTYPPLILRAAERLQPFLGDCEAVSIRYGKVVLALFRVIDLLIVVTFNSVEETPFLTRIGEEIRRILQTS